LLWMVDIGVLVDVKPGNVQRYRRAFNEYLDLTNRGEFRSYDGGGPVPVGQEAWEGFGETEVPTYRTTTVMTMARDRARSDIKVFHASGLRLKPLAQIRPGIRLRHVSNSCLSGAYRTPLGLSCVHSSRHVIVNIEIFAVKTGRNISRHLAAFDLAVVCGEDRPLDLLAALGIDGVRDVGVQLEAVLAVSVAVGKVTVFVETPAAVVAETGAEVVFLRAVWAMIAEFAGRHGQEKPVVAVNELYVADDESPVEGERAERLEAATAPGAEVDTNFRQMHGAPPGCEKDMKRRSEGGRREKPVRSAANVADGSALPGGETRFRFRIANGRTTSVPGR